MIYQFYIQPFILLSWDIKQICKQSIFMQKKNHPMISHSLHSFSSILYFK